MSSTSFCTPSSINCCTWPSTLFRLEPSVSEPWMDTTPEPAFSMSTVMSRGMAAPYHRPLSRRAAHVDCPPDGVASTPSVHLDRAILAVGDLVEQPTHDGTQKRHQRGPAEDVDERQQHGLLLQLPVDKSHRSARSGCCSQVVTQVRAGCVQLLLQSVPALRKVRCQLRLMEVGAANQERLCRRNPD